MKMWRLALLLCAATSLGSAVAAGAVTDCSMVLRISESLYTGSYNLVNGDSTVYRAGKNGWQPEAESRNWFAFEIPELGAPLVGAELRVHADLVWPTNITMTYTLHQVTTSFDDLAYHAGNRTNTFNDLGDGPVYGQRTISSTEGWWRGRASALLGIRLNAAALEEITAKQNGWFCLGGVGAPGPPFTGGWVFDTGFAPPLPLEIHLVLYFSNAGSPQVSAIAYDPSLTRLSDERVNLSALACGKEPLHRQWFRNGDLIPDATNEIIAIRQVTGSDSGYYELVASNELGTASSGPVYLTVTPARISQQPQSVTLGEGQYHTLSVSAQGNLQLSYQWRKNGTNLIGGDRRTLSLNGVRLEDAGAYDVIIYDSTAVMTSEVAYVTVNVAPPILPSGQETEYQVAVGLPLNLTFTVFGGRPTQQQWFRDGDPVPGATSNLLHIASVGFNDAGRYWLVVANSAGAATSWVTRVIVEPLVIYNFSDRQVLWLNPVTLQPVVQSSAPASFQWFHNDAPLPTETNSLIRFEAFDYANEGAYFLVASNAYGAATSTVATLTVFTQAPLVSAGPSFTRAWVGGDVTFSGTAYAGPPATVRWLFNGTPLTGATQGLLILKDITTNQSGQYTFGARNSLGVVTSGPLTLEVLREAPFFVSLPRITNALEGEIVTLRAKAVGGPPPAYQWRRNGVDLPGQTNGSLALGTVKTSDSGLYELVARNEAGQVSYQHRLTVSAPTGLDRWQWRLPQPQGSRLYDVAYGNGRYVAVGKAGNILTSADGHHWTSTTIKSEADFRRVVFGNGVFVVTGNFYDMLFATNQNKFYNDFYIHALRDEAGITLVSSNGIDWAPALIPDRNVITELAFGNGIFLASGPDARTIYTSSDGMHWQTVPQLESGTGNITFGNGRFVANRDYDQSYVISSSLNGIDWAPSTQPSGWITFADGRFFAWNYNEIYESLNGETWTRIGQLFPLVPDVNFAGAEGTFVAAGSVPAGQVLYSSDAVRWIPIDTGTRQEIERVIYANGEFLAVGEAGTITRSSNGLNWTSDEVANKIDFYGLTHGEGLHVVAGDAGTILTSSNGLDWTRRATPSTRNLHAVAYGDGKFVASGRSGVIMTSDEGLSWTERDSNTGNYIERIAWANGLWVAVTEGGDVSTSSNALNWTAINTGLPLTDHEGVAYGNGRWVVVGGYFDPDAVTTIFTSADAASWTRQGPNFGKRLRDVTYGRGMFVAVGNDGLVLYSTNGLFWSGHYQGYQNLRRVHYANGRFVAVGNDGTLISSTDAKKSAWTKHGIFNSQNLHDIITAPDGTFMFAGNNGMLMQSGNTRPHFLAVGRDGRLEFDPGIAATLRLERSSDLHAWDTEALSVTSPHNATIGSERRFWRLVGE